MRWPRRGILIRLAIYVPLIAFLVWRAQGGCDQGQRATPDDGLDHKLEPHRKVITLPDGTQQEIVELTAEEAEAILGHPIPRNLEEAGEAKADVKTGTDAKADVKTGTDAKTDVKTDMKADVKTDATPGD
jgi:hypothetical protein